MCAICLDPACVDACIWPGRTWTGATARKPLVHRELTPEEAKRLNPDLTPIDATPAERIAAGVIPIHPKEKPMEPVVSPTGTPVISGQAIITKIAIVIVALAGVALVSDFFPATTIDEKIAGAIVALGSALGIASPGVRK
jgi:hypothetical protein